MRRYTSALIFTVTLSSLASLTQASTTPDPQAATAPSIPALEAGLRTAVSAGDVTAQLRARRDLASARLALGEPERAIAELTQALALTDRQPDAGWSTLLRGQLANVYLHMGQTAAARPLLETALASAQARGDNRLRGAILIDLGRLYSFNKESGPALNAYVEAAAAAKAAAAPALGVNALLHAATLRLELDEPRAARDSALAALDLAGTISAPRERAEALVRVAQTLIQVARHDHSEAAASLTPAYETLTTALTLARELKEPRLVSSAQGSLGTIYLLNERADDALTLTRQAIDTAQAARAPDLLLAWHWQAARIFRQTPVQLDKAIASYRLATTAYEQRALNAAPGSVLPIGEPVTTLFTELADLLLQRSARSRDAAAVRADLEAARTAMEQLKARELQDYFRDNCVAQARVRTQSIAQGIEPATAVLYPIVLADRLELLLSHGPDLRRVTVPVTGARVQDTARRFRTEVERRRTQAYLEPAQTLHQWLLAPIDRQLQTWGVSTLVVVPDPALRSIPFAALHDGKEFAIRRYAIAMVPGLDLTDPRPLPRQGVQTLLAGVTESVQGYPTLEHVDGELRSIHKLFGGELLLNADFRHERLEQALTARRYRIAHIASHGEFAGNVAQSFVLAYDRKISMDELSRFIGYNRFRDDPLDLLTLSACHTAAGDERAALGLAGIAVKAGARSAVAALWPIHDEAAAVLMEEFYRQLHTPETSKAVALQRAQTKLAGLTRYRHPGYWSSFVLIGSWR